MKKKVAPMTPYSSIFDSLLDNGAFKSLFLDYEHTADHGQDMKADFLIAFAEEVRRERR